MIPQAFQVRVIPGEELDDSLAARWLEIQQAVPAFDNPYFRPEFTRAVARIRRDVEVALLERDGAIVGFFPYQRSGRHVARPVGGRLSDFQAVIADPDCDYDMPDLLRGCGLHAWDFDHLVDVRPSVEPYCYLRDGSPYLDFSGGFEQYVRVRTAMGDDELRQTARKARKLVREVGPLRLVFDCQDARLLEILMRWKSDQYRRTRITDVLSFRWTRELLEHLLHHSDDGFRGVLSALYAGNVLVALHFGMLSRGVLHYWFPSYDTNYGQYSPGRVMLLEIARFSRTLGLRRLDLGRGMAPYKVRIMTGCTEVAVGSLDLRPMTAAVRTQWRKAQDWVRRSPWRRHARVPGRVLYWLREWMAFR